MIFVLFRFSATVAEIVGIVALWSELTTHTHTNSQAAAAEHRQHNNSIERGGKHIWYFIIFYCGLLYTLFRSKMPIFILIMVKKIVIVFNFRSHCFIFFLFVKCLEQFFNNCTSIHTLLWHWTKATEGNWVHSLKNQNKRCIFIRFTNRWKEVEEKKMLIISHSGNLIVI